MGVLIITHHERLLVFNKPNKTHVILAGRIVETGDADLARQLHSTGYGAVRERHPDAAALEKMALEKSANRTVAGKDVDGRDRRDFRSRSDRVVKEIEERSKQKENGGLRPGA